MPATPLLFEAVESLISSIPTPRQFERWESLSEQQKENPVNKLPVDMGVVKANCKRLESIITIGSSISDYPGLLAIGNIRWNARGEIYTIQVNMPGEEFEYGGFRLIFGSNMIITAKEKNEIEF